MRRHTRSACTALLALASVVALSACGSSSKSSGASGSSGKSGGTVTLVMGTAPDSLDPGMGYTTQAAEPDWPRPGEAPRDRVARTVAHEVIRVGISPPRVKPEHVHVPQRRGADNAGLGQCAVGAKHASVERCVRA